MSRISSQFEMSLFMTVTLGVELEKWALSIKGNKGVRHEFKWRLERLLDSTRWITNYIKESNKIEDQDAIDYLEDMAEMFSKIMDKIREAKDYRKQEEMILILGDYLDGKTDIIHEDYMTQSQVVAFVKSLTKGSALTDEIIINSYNNFKK